MYDFHMHSSLNDSLFETILQLLPKPSCVVYLIRDKAGASNWNWRSQRKNLHTYGNIEVWKCRSTLTWSLYFNILKNKWSINARISSQSHVFKLKMIYFICVPKKWDSGNLWCHHQHSFLCSSSNDTLFNSFFVETANQTIHYHLKCFKLTNQHFKKMRPRNPMKPNW